MNAIIFGVNGQDGFYMNELCIKNNIEVTGVSRTNANWVLGSVAELNFVEQIIKKLQPDYIFHLAANSSTRHDVLFENHETISTGTLNILEAVYRFSPQTKVFLSGSGLQFQNNGLPINESDPFAATSPYAIARIQSVYAARYYRQLGIKAYVGYFFNHDSPLRSERHVNQKIIMAARRIANGSKERLEIGDITVKKEFSYAGDIVKAVWVLVNNNNVFECVIGSGQAYSIEDWIDLCFNRFGLDWKNFVTINTRFKREYEVLVSDPRTIFSLGWKPEKNFKDLADLMINA